VSGSIDHLHHSELLIITALPLISTLHKSTQHPLSLFQPAVLTSRSLATVPNSGDSSASCAHVLLSHPPRAELLSVLLSAGLGSALYSLGVDPTKNTAFNSSSIVGVSTDPFPRNGRLFIRLLHTNGCTRSLCAAWGHHATISRFEMKSFLKLVTALYVSAYSAIIRCVAIRGNCWAFRATEIRVFLILLLLVGWDWVHLVLRPLFGLLYQPRMIDDDDDEECGAVGGMKIGWGNRSSRRNPIPESLCPPQIPHDLTWSRTRAAVVGSRRLTAWAMPRAPCFHIYNSSKWTQCSSTFCATYVYIASVMCNDKVCFYFIFMVHL
jgi:hypothetical protein